MNEFYNDPRFHFADHARDLITGAAFIFMAIGLVLAASSVGAEWQSGTFASLLTWEPRRQRVLAAKLVAPVLGLLALAIPLMLLLEGGGWLAADLRGTTQGADAHLFWQIASQYGRVVGLLALVALIGAALAAVTRHTVAVLALVGGYLIAGEIVAGIASAWWRNHGLFAHLIAFVRGNYDYFTNTRTLGGLRMQQHFLHADSSAIIVAIIAAVAVVLAAVTLQRRDVA